MSNFVSTTKIPKWRIALWGVLAIGAFVWIGHALGDRRIVWAGVICVPVIITLMLGIIRIGSSQWTLRHLGLLLFIYVVLQTVLLLWRFLER